MLGLERYRGGMMLTGRLRRVVWQMGDAGVRHWSKEPKKFATPSFKRDSQSVRGMAAFDFIDLTLSSNESVIT